MRVALLAPTPEEILRELSALEEVVNVLRGLSPDRSERGEIEALQGEVRQVARLIESAAEFHAGWAKVLAAAAGGYTPAGAPVPLDTPSSLSVQG